ncbi:MAG: DeoR/GlpR family DNA-binding transcription regulator [Treponema sp.]|jgi:DeoR family deoxyribose operon repressor|nr:DeoR/GlpR family DNA-binding transcription regulator [Treponema sp.]
MEKIDTRREKILTALKTNNVLSITTLADMLKVSTMTIRRDLEFLAGQGMVQFYHGGAVINSRFLEKDTNPNNYYLQQQTLLHREEKTLIAKKASELLLSQETIMLDSGTSIYYLAKELPDNRDLTVISWSLNVIEELIRKPQNKILVQGGIYHQETQMFENTQGLDTIKNSRASKVFISAGGFHMNLGITTPFHYEVETKRAAIKYSMTSVLLMDSSKFGKVCSAHMTDVSDFQIVITDSGIPPEYERYIRNAGLELLIV